jgi:putative alpha-1,2-mannosidase
MKDGSWLPDFEPCGPHAAKGFTEADSAIYTHFVPQDIPGLMRLFGGADKYVAALNRQFELVSTNHFVSKGSRRELEWVDYGNQPSTAMAHLFNLAGAPWLSQKWVRAVKEETFGDTTPDGGYHGDEDQGQMGALGGLMAIGLFDVQGGAAREPEYQLTSPLFDRITIHLDRKYFPGRTFTIVARNNEPKNIYIQSARLNGKQLQQCRIPNAELTKGGKLELTLGPEPNREWGVDDGVK